MIKRDTGIAAPTLARILERIENARRLAQLSLHHQEQAAAEAGQAVTALKEVEADLTRLSRAEVRS